MIVLLDRDRACGSFTAFLPQGLRELEEENRIQSLAEQNRALKEELRELEENYDLLIDILSGGK